MLATRLLVESHCTRVGDQLRPRPGGRPSPWPCPLADLRAAADAATWPGYVAADRDFHATIVAADGNTILIRLYAILRDRQLRMGAANLLAADGRSTRPDGHHRRRPRGHRRRDRRRRSQQLAERLTREHLAHADRALRGAARMRALDSAPVHPLRHQVWPAEPW